MAIKTRARDHVRQPLNLRRLILGAHRVGASWHLRDSITIIATKKVGTCHIFQHQDIRAIHSYRNISPLWLRGPFIRAHKDFFAQLTATNMILC